MNKQQRIKLVNDNMQKIVVSSRTLNCVRYNTHNKPKHELKKASICLDAQIKGFDYVTEAKFKNGSGTADIYIPELDWAIEVLDSETMARFNKKNYPVKRIIPVRVEEKFEV